MTNQPSEPTTRWVDCPGCDGEVGIPAGWTEETVSCPQCGAVVAAKQEPAVQWRKKEAKADAGRARPNPAKPTPAPSKPKEKYGIDESPPWLWGALTWCPITLVLVVSIMVWHQGTEGDTKPFDPQVGIFAGVVINPGAWILFGLWIYALNKSGWLGCPHCGRRLKWPKERRYDPRIGCKVCKGLILRPPSWKGRERARPVSAAAETCPHCQTKLNGRPSSCPKCRTRFFWHGGKCEYYPP